MSIMFTYEAYVKLPNALRKDFHTNFLKRIAMTRTAIFPQDRHALYEQHGYSAAIKSQDLLFVSGQVGSREDGSPEPDFENR